MVSSAQKTSIVLIADDDAATRDSLRSAFEAQRLTVIEAADGESARLSCLHLHPDLLIISSGLAGSLELCTTIKITPELKHILILVMLTLEDEPRLNLFFDAGVEDGTIKPLRLPLILRRSLRLLNEKAQREEISFQREILMQMADAVIAVDSESTVIYWNNEAERAYGIPAEEILGKPVASAYQIEGFTPETRNQVVSSAATDSWRGEGVHVKRSGERMDVEVSVRGLRNEQGVSFGHITVVRNISQRKRIEEALREERELAQALHDTIAALTRTLDPQGVMRLILEHLGRVVPHKTANIMIIEGDKAHVGYSSGYAPDVEASINKLVFSPDEMPNFARMVMTREPHLVSDTTKDPEWKWMDGWAWVRSYLGMPITAYDHVIGFLNVDSDIPNAFTPLHAERMRVFADQAAIAIENAQLYDAIYRDAVEMRTLHKATDFLYATNLFAANNLVDICEQIVRVVVNEFGKVDCGVLLIDDNSDALMRVARTGALQVNALRPLHLDGPGLVPACVRSGTTVYAPDVTSDERYVHNNPSTLSELVVPLRTAQGVIGVLDLQSGQYDAFDQHDIRLMEVFAERAATAIENVKLYNEIRRYAEQLEERVQERTGELARVKERAEGILNNSSDAILLIRSNGAIQQGNRAFDMMFGYEADEAFGKPFSIVAKPEHQLPMKEALDRVLAAGNAERLEILAQRSNGLIFDADVTFSPVISSGKQITSIVCSVRDITARKRLEMELREALQKERELNEMKSQFIARASHEFRTPLAVILTSSDLLRNYGSRMSQDQRDEKLDRLQREVRGIATMLDDLLTISKGEEVKEFDPELVDLQRLIRQTTNEVGDAMGNAHTLKVDCQGSCVSVYADSKLVNRIITNLLSNAIKYSPIGSTIQVNVTCGTSRIVIEVIDQGIGIPDDDKVRLFEAFHRAKNVEHISGTGLGLAIVKQAVDLHGGEVSVKSQLGKGSNFTVILPNLAVKEKSQ